MVIVEIPKDGQGNRVLVQIPQTDLVKYFEKYEELFDAHSEDINYLKKSAKEIACWMQNIDARCSTICTKLYPPE